MVGANGGARGVKERQGRSQLVDEAVAKAGGRRSKVADAGDPPGRVGSGKEMVHQRVV